MAWGRWHKGIKPSDWIPDYEMCLEEEIERWKRDLEEEKHGRTDFEGDYGFGIYE